MTSILISSWQQQGISQGLHVGKEGLVSRMIKRRFGAVPDAVAERLEQLSSEQLDDLGEALFEFADVSDLERWVTRHPPIGTG